MDIKNKTYNIIVIGCQMNKSDSERMSGYMQLHGFKETSKEKAGVVFITTCGIRQTSEDRVYGFVPAIKKKNKDVIMVVTGCLSRREDVKRRLKHNVDIWLPIDELPGLSEKLGIKSEQDKYKNYLNVKPEYTSKYLAYVPIGNGCDNFCTYCVVPFARGREVYRDANEVLSEIKELVKSGYKEISIIAQNVNSYSSVRSTCHSEWNGAKSKNSGNQESLLLQRDPSAIAQDDREIIKFPELLKMINNIDGDFWVRFSSSHPKDMSDDLITIVAECDKVCNHIHLPVQSGNNEILEKMNRKYTIEHYLELINKIRKTIPNASITTDTIVGFPGETEEQFNNTVKLYKEVGFDMSYVSKFSPRFGTAAAKMDDDVTIEEKKRREEVLVKIINESSFDKNKELVDKVFKVLIEGVSRKGKLFGKLENFKSVKVDFDEKTMIHEDFLGRFVNVKVTKAEELALFGEIIK